MLQMMVILLLIVLILFGLASISQSYATAQQAQAMIEANRATQIASAGNLVTILMIALLLASSLVAVAVIAYLVYRVKTKIQPGISQGQWVSGPNANFGRVGQVGQSAGQLGQPSANELLPAMLTMLLVQMLRQQAGPVQGANQPFTLEEPLDQQLPSLTDDFWSM
jgi:imidazolonepropionase-like amidohydrolase